MKHIIHTAYLIMFFFSLISCKPQVPKNIIQPKEMENILYDYNLANVIASESDKNIYAYQLSVLNKYNVDKELFDTSMVYYMRHTDKMQEIYNNLQKRVSAENKRISNEENALGQINNNNKNAQDIWKGKKSILLTTTMPFNIFSFNIIADKSLKKGDKITLTFNSQFIFQDGVRDGTAKLAVIFNNDSTAIESLNISSSTSYNLKIEDTKNIGIKEIRGYFILNKESIAETTSSTLRIMSISNIQLIRTHIIKKASVKANKQIKSKPTNDSVAIKSSKIALRSNERS